jgi:hypothetical protein
MLLTLVLLAATASLLVFIAPRLDRPVAWALGTALAMLAGFRTGGFDYEEYLLNIDGVRAAAGADWLTRLLFAKDPLFLFIVEFSGTFTANPRPVFLAVAAISVFTKVAATSAIPRRRTYFLAFYMIFLAPGLEYAAIRAGMAIGLLMMALYGVSRWRAGWAVLAVLGHYSVAMAWIGRLLVTHRWSIATPLLLAVPLALPLLAAFGQDDPRYATYFENPGTLYALVLPMLTVFALAGLYAARRKLHRPKPIVSAEAMMASAICVAAALVLALPFVTVSYRIIEIAWALMLAQWLALGTLGSRHLLARIASGGLLLAALTLTNVLGEKWSILAEMTL